MESSPLAEVVKALTNIQQTQNHAHLEVRREQEQRFQALLQAQAEDRQALQSLISREGAGAASSSEPVPLLALAKMGPRDDLEAFLGLPDQWAARLLPLLSGEAQLAAQQLPAASFLDHNHLKKAIQQWVGWTPEQSRQLFRSLRFEKDGCLLAFAQQFRDACRKWLLVWGTRNIVEVVEMVLLEQFVFQLPRGMSEWVQ